MKEKRYKKILEKFIKSDKNYNYTSYFKKDDSINDAIIIATHFRTKEAIYEYSKHDNSGTWPSSKHHDILNLRCYTGGEFDSAIHLALALSPTILADYREERINEILEI